MLSSGWFAVLGALLLGSFLQSGSLVMLAFLGGAFLGIVTLGARTCLRGLTFVRYLRGNRLFPDETCDVEWQLYNDKPLPVSWIHLEDECPDALQVLEGVHAQPYLPGRQQWIHVYTLRPFERVRHRIRVRATRRGVFTLGPGLSRASDVFGFTLHRRVFEASGEIVVYPRTFSLPSLGLPARHPFGDLRSRRWILQDPLQVVGAREVTSGEETRSIHWKATARMRRLHRKVIEASSQPVFVVVLDLSPRLGARYESLDPEVAERAIEMAASIAQWACTQRLRVGLRSNASRVRLGGFEVTPSSHPRQLVRLLDALARVSSQATGSAERLFGGLAPSMPYGSTVVVVTATCPPELFRVVSKWRSRGFGVACVDYSAGDRTDVPERMRNGGARYWHVSDLAAATRSDVVVGSRG